MARIPERQRNVKSFKGYLKSEGFTEAEIDKLWGLPATSIDAIIEDFNNSSISESSNIFRELKSLIRKSP